MISNENALDLELDFVCRSYHEQPTRQDKYYKLTYFLIYIQIFNRFYNSDNKSNKVTKNKIKQTADVLFSKNEFDKSKSLLFSYLRRDLLLDRTR